jgi:hypothetical protein
MLFTLDEVFFQRSRLSTGTTCRFEAPSAAPLARELSRVVRLSNLREISIVLEAPEEKQVTEVTGSPTREYRNTNCAGECA